MWHRVLFNTHQRGVRHELIHHGCQRAQHLPLYHAASAATPCQTAVLLRRVRRGDGAPLPPRALHQVRRVEHLARLCADDKNPRGTSVSAQQQTDGTEESAK